MCPLEMSGAAPMKTHQHGCLKMTQMRTKLVDFLTEKGKAQEDSVLDKELQASKEC